jgi:nucleotide-binding universal stress UspA family protein
MFNRIVVPLDGTRFAEAALAPARELARAFDSRIMVTRALSPSGLPMVAIVWDEERELDRIDEADEYLRRIVDDLRDQGYKADLLLRLAEPGAGIVKAAELDHADLILMTTHLRWKVVPSGGPSTTLGVLARSRTPILAWRAREPLEPEGGPDVGARPALLNRSESPILVPLDGSHFAEGALAAAETLARMFGLYLVLVRAVEPAATSDVERQDERAATEYLQRVRRAVEQRGVRAEIAVRRGTPVGVIDRLWRERDAGLIVLASHGRGGLTGTFLGSVAASLLEEVEAPILVVRPDELDDQPSNHVTPPTITRHEVKR